MTNLFPKPATQWPAEPGRAIAVPVHPRDVLPWTKPGCKTCTGRGIYTVIQATKDGKPLPKAEYTRATKMCDCGLKRFKKIQPTYVHNGRLYAVEPWVAVHPETVAEAIEASKKAEEEKAAAESDPTIAREVDSATP